MDIAAQQAREHHREAGRLEAQAARHRAVRDDMVRRLRAGDQARWTYLALAKAVGCSPELIAYIIKSVPVVPPRTPMPLGLLPLPV